MNSWGTVFGWYADRTHIRHWVAPPETINQVPEQLAGLRRAAAVLLAASVTLLTLTSMAVVGLVVVGMAEPGEVAGHAPVTPIVFVTALLAWLLAFGLLLGSYCLVRTMSRGATAGVTVLMAAGMGVGVVQLASGQFFLILAGMVWILVCLPAAGLMWLRPDSRSYLFGYLTPEQLKAAEAAGYGAAARYSVDGVPGHGDTRWMTTAWSTRTETADDQAVVRRINEAAFGRAEEADLVDALRAEPNWLPGLSILSTTPDGTAVGYALLTRCTIGEVPALALAPCAVLPEYQRTGAGEAAIRTALAAAQAAGERFVVVLGHATYYPRLGFTRASAAGVRLSIDVPDEALMVLSLTGEPVPSGLVGYAAPFGI